MPQRPIQNAIRQAESGFRPAGFGSDTHMAGGMLTPRRTQPTTGNGRRPMGPTQASGGKS